MILKNMGLIGKNGMIMKDQKLNNYHKDILN